MDPLGKKELLDFYDRHRKILQAYSKSMRCTADGQRRRYETLLEMAGDISGKNILDFGCGKGDFYAFLKEKGLSWQDIAVLILIKI